MIQYCCFQKRCCIAGVVFWVDIIMGFAIGFVAVYNLKRLVILDLRLIADFYIWKSTFFCDVIAALPIIAEVMLQGKMRKWITAQMNHMSSGLLISFIESLDPFAKKHNLSMNACLRSDLWAPSRLDCTAKNALIKCRCGDSKGCFGACRLWCCACQGQEARRLCMSYSSCALLECSGSSKW